MTEQIVEQEPEDDQITDRDQIIDAIVALAEERDWDTEAGFEALMALAVSAFVTRAREEGMGADAMRAGLLERAEELVDEATESDKKTWGLH